MAKHWVLILVNLLLLAMPCLADGVSSGGGLSARSGWLVSGGNAFNVPNGNVGIGSTNPQCKLDVGPGGNICIAGVPFSGSGGFTITDGSHTVTGTTNLSVTGGTVGGSTPNATLLVTGGTGTVTSSGSPVSGNIPKFTTATNISPAAASDIVNLFSTCSGTQYLGADGACHTASGGTGSNFWNLEAANVGINTTYNVGIGTVTTSKLLTIGSLGQTTIDSSGNIAVNSGKIDIGNAGDAQTYSQVRNYATQPAYEFRNASGQGYVGLSSGGIIELGAGAGAAQGIPPLYTQLANKYTGVGGDAIHAAYPLDVVSGDYITLNGNIKGIERVVFDATTPNGGVILGMDSTGGAASGVIASVGSNSNLRFFTDPSGTYTEAMRINPVGNVGIGTTIPPNLLYVAGIGEFQGFKLNTAPTAGWVLTTNSVGVGTWQPAPTGAGGSPAGGNKAVQYNSVGSFAGDETKLSFDGTNLGIGTTTANNALEVVGAVSVAATANSQFVTSSPSAGKMQIEGNVGIGTTAMQNSALTVMSGNVGIGTTIPGGPLDVGPYTNNFLIGAGGNVGIGTITTTENTNTQLQVRNAGNATNIVNMISNAGSGVFTVANSGATTSASTVTATSLTSSVAGNSFTGSAASAGSLVNTAISQTNTTTGTVRGATVTATLSSNSPNAATQSDIGTVNRASYTGTGTLIDAMGTFSDCQKATSASGIVSDCYSIYATQPAASGGGTITRAHSIYAVGDIESGGNVGIGTVQTTPSPNGSLIVYVGNVGIGTATPPQALSISGVIGFKQNAPTISSCGTTPSGSVVGNDAQGTITVGGTATACTLAFIGTYAKSPHCNITNQQMSITNAMTYTESVTGFVVSQAVGLSGDLLDYHCTFDN